MAEKSPVDTLPEKDRFYHMFGQTLAEWAEIESRLSHFFSHAAGLDFEAGDTIFFSGKSFQARNDMLSASLVHSRTLVDGAREFIETVIYKASLYSQFRNKLAHGLMHPNELDDDGEPKEWRIKEGDKWQMPDGIAFDELAAAAKNFADLNLILMHAFGRLACEKGSPTEYLQQLALLPNEAGSSQLSRKQLGQLRQRTAALRSRRRDPRDPAE